MEDLNKIVNMMKRNKGKIFKILLQTVLKKILFLLLTPVKFKLLLRHEISPYNTIFEVSA